MDMNLSPAWVEFLANHGFEAVHWSTVGDPTDWDGTVMDWARQHNSVVFTRDLDFSALLAHTGAGGPSVLQARTHDALLPSATTSFGFYKNIVRH